MNKIEIVSYNPHYDGDMYLNGVIACYQQSFAGPPWDESHVCPHCNRQFGTDEVMTLQLPLICPSAGCTGQLQEFWPAKQIQTDFLSETKFDTTTNRQPSSWIAVDNGTVIGICWGYTVTPQALAEKIELPNFAQQLFGRFGDETNLVAYQDELAVLPTYRGKRFSSLNGKSIARALVEARHTEFQKFGVRIGAVRTLEEPATRTFEWYTKVGFEVIARYPDNPHRVILARSFTGLRY